MANAEYVFEVYLGDAWLGTVRAKTEKEAAAKARRRFGQHLAGLLRVELQGAA